MLLYVSLWLDLYHDGHSNENVKNYSGVLLRNRQIHGEFMHGHTVFRKHVCGRHGCGRNGHCLWQSWFVAVIVEPPVVDSVCGAADGSIRYNE